MAAKHRFYGSFFYELEFAFPDPGFYMVPGTWHWEPDSCPQQQPVPADIAVRKDNVREHGKEEESEGICLHFSDLLLHVVGIFSIN